MDASIAMAGSSAKRLVGALVILAAAFAVLAFLFVLYADDTDFGGIDLGEDAKLYGLVASAGIGVIVLVALVLILLSRSWNRKDQIAEEAELFFIPESPDAAPAPTTTYDVAVPEVYDLAAVPLQARAWGPAEMDGKRHPFYYPRAIDGGFYVNDYIPIDGTWKVLKLRTLLGGPSDNGLPTTRSNAIPTPPPSEPDERIVTVRAERAPERPAARLTLQEVAPEALPPVTKTEEVYFDYPGDSHEVEALEGIGPTYGKRLRDAGVLTTARLGYEDAGKLANAVQVPRGTVEAWQQMAQLVKVKGIGPQYAEALVRAGIGGIEDLKRRSPARMAEQVNAYLATLDVNVLGNKITEKRIEGWKESAKQLKRVRLAVPAQ